MAESKPKPYSRKRAKTKVVKGDAQKKEGISVPVEKKEAPKKAPEPEMKTKGGKEWQVVQNGMMYAIQFKTGGQIPEQLSGSYTKKDIAWSAIRAYENSRGS